MTKFNYKFEIAGLEDYQKQSAIIVMKMQELQHEINKLNNLEFGLRTKLEEEQED